jgi:hypothetical protein
MDTVCSRKALSVNYLGQIRKELLQKFLLPYEEYLAAEGLHCASLHEANYEQLFFILNLPIKKPHNLMKALAYIRNVATFEGLALMIATAEENNLVLDFANPTPPDIAMQILVNAPELLERLYREELSIQGRAFNCFSCKDKAKFCTLNISAVSINALENSLDQWFALKNYGTKSRLYVYHSHEQMSYMAISHGLYDMPLNNGDQRTAMPHYSPRAFDFIQYNHALNEIAIQGATNEFVTIYKELIGKHFLGSKDYFDVMEKFNLSPLQESIKNSLQCKDVPGITLVRLTELRLMVDVGEIDTLTSKNCLSVFRNHIPIAGNELHEAMFTIHIQDEDKPQFIKIKLPNVITYSSNEYANLMNNWLMRRGFMKQDENAETRKTLVCY